MLDNIASIDRIDKQYRDPETLLPEDFQLYIRETEQINKILSDIQEEELINKGSEK